MTEHYVEFTEDLIKALVDYPEEVSLTKSSDHMGILLELSLNQMDMGRVIGKRGETIQAIRRIIHIIGMQENARVSLKVLEPS